MPRGRPNVWYGADARLKAGVVVGGRLSVGAIEAVEMDLLLDSWVLEGSSKVAASGILIGTAHRATATIVSGV